MSANLAALDGSRSDDERSHLLLTAVVLLILAAASVVAVLALRSRIAPGQGAEHVVMPTSPQIEADYGIRIERVSLIGDGGLVELRYVLLDAGKAGILHDEENDFRDDFPHILAGATSIDEPTFHHHGGDLVTGRQLSILYGNLDGAVEEGGTVSIEIGSDRLDGVPVG